MNINKVQWVITAYLPAMSIMMPSAGWLSRRLGKRKLFIAGLFVFTAASGKAVTVLHW